MNDKSLTLIEIEKIKEMHLVILICLTSVLVLLVNIALIYFWLIIIFW